jgi:hypothetical protein
MTRNVHDREEWHFGDFTATFVELSSTVLDLPAGTLIEDVLRYIDEHLTRLETPFTFTGDAVIIPGFTGDGIILRTQAGSFTGDAITRKPQAGSLTGDGVLLRSQGGSLAGDAVILKTQAGSFTGDAWIIVAGGSGSLTGDAVVLRVRQASFIGDAVIGSDATLGEYVLAEDTLG